MNKHGFLSAFTSKIKAVEVEGTTCHLRSISGAERDSFLRSLTDEDYLSREKLLTRCICDSDGKRLFSDEEVSEVAGLPSVVLEALIVPAQELSGLGSKSVDESKKN